MVLSRSYIYQSSNLILVASCFTASSFSTKLIIIFYFFSASSFFSWDRFLNTTRGYFFFLRLSFLPGVSSSAGCTSTFYSSSCSFAGAFFTLTIWNGFILLLFWALTSGGVSWGLSLLWSPYLSSFFASTFMGLLTFTCSPSSYASPFCFFFGFVM